MQILIKQRKAGIVLSKFLLRQFRENIPSCIQQQCKQQQQLLAVQNGRCRGVKKGFLHDGLYRLGASGSQHLIQGLEQRRKLELALNHGFLCAQHRRVGIFIRNQQPPGALVNHFINPPQQAILLTEPLKGDRISHHNAHGAICRVIELLLHALKYRIQVLGGGWGIVRRILKQPHKGVIFRDKALHC